MHGATYGSATYDNFTRAVENCYLTMDACKVWLLWYLHGATYGYHGNIYEASYGYVLTNLHPFFVKKHFLNFFVECK